MTEVEDAVAAFRWALSPWARAVIDMSEFVVADVHLAVAAGWAPDMLAQHVEYHTLGLENAGQVMRWRLHKAAHPDETDGSDAA